MAATASARATTARLDPWIVSVESDAGGCSPSPFLFGWAAHHHRLNGFTWMRPSTVVTLEEAGKHAATASGTRYVLGRRAMRPEDLSGEGCIAWKALVLGEASAFERRCWARTKPHGGSASRRRSTPTRSRRSSRATPPITSRSARSSPPDRKVRRKAVADMHARLRKLLNARGSQSEARRAAPPAPSRERPFGHAPASRADRRPTADPCPRATGGAGRLGERPRPHPRHWTTGAPDHPGVVPGAGRYPGAGRDGFRYSNSRPGIEPAADAERDRCPRRPG